MEYSIQSVKGLQPQPWRVYYDKYGKEHKLPADTYSIEHYLKAGFSLAKPEKPIEMPQPLEDKHMVDTFEPKEFTCELCHESFDTNWRLSKHERTHRTKTGRLKKKMMIGG